MAVRRRSGGVGERPDGAIACLPDGPGVYRFRDGRGRVLYVGRATSLRQRVASYWSDLGDRAHLARMLPAVARVEAVPCDSVYEATWLERNLLEEGLPRWNRTPGGQESEVYVRVDPDPARPGLRVVHQVEHGGGRGVRCYGPHLGWEQVSRAVAGLRRAVPLALTGTGLTGSEREAARRVSVGPADRPRLLRTLDRVLGGDACAAGGVRRELERMRDAAAGGLAFELAARLQGEIEGLVWITSPQRVTLAEARDFEVHGWAGGTLVTFRFRAGRLREWSSTSCSEPAAAPRLASSPREWAPFADRGARLAACLAHV